MLAKAIHSNTGSMIVSIVLGLGLAALFRRACAGKACLTIKAPPVKETQEYVYKIDDECYKYTALMTQCPGSG